MKNTKLIIGIAAILGIIALVFLFKDKFTGKKESLKDFAIEDTSSIEKVILTSNASPDDIVLTKAAPGRWMVNNQYYARVDMIDNMMLAIKKITVKAPVALAARENIIKRLATNSIKVQIFQKGDKRKCYFVGSATQDQIGTFMLMENSSEPFICFVPGHKGFLTNFFMPVELQWRDRLIFTYNLTDIKSITTEFDNEPEQNYTVEVMGKNEFKIRSHKTNQYLPAFDTSALKSYIREFKNIAFEDFTSVPPEKMDSVKKKYKLFTITVQETTGNNRWVKGYMVPFPRETYDEFNNLVKFDPDKMYGEVSGIKEQVILQYLTFDKITKPLVYFTNPGGYK